MAALGSLSDRDPMSTASAGLTKFPPSASRSTSCKSCTASSSQVPPSPSLLPPFTVPTGQRAYHAAVYFEERLYLFGGRQSDTTLMADSWYRDDRLPTVNLKTKPEPNTPQWTFRFASDEPGCVFEYRIWDVLKFKEIRPWTAVLHKTSVEWLDWRVGGPGNGRYALYVRAVDPAGNRDEMYETGRNVYAWNYVSPTPWDIIFGCLTGFIFLAFLAYLEYRRRAKKAAMERYAMKRMRRKFKAMQRDMDGRAVDWRTLYQEVLPPPPLPP
jgi:hypothetical protein